MSYDQECYTLAVLFLTDEGIASTEEFNRLADQLAQEIQNKIEEFLQYVPKAAINDG